MREIRLSWRDLLFWPLSLPLKGFLMVAGEIRDMAMRELGDTETLRSRLVDLQLRYEAGEIGEEEYVRSWEELTARLAAAERAGGEREL